MKKVSLQSSIHKPVADHYISLDGINSDDATPLKQNNYYSNE